jgi:carboxypeptidase D
MWMWGKDDVNSGEDLIIWINGGPGCSSMFGLTHENGPFHIQETENDVNKPNEYSWTKISNIIYVDQPANVGFSTGRTYFTNETQIAKEFVSFLKHFYEIFPELKAKKLWITGESYAGVYLPPILAEIYKSGVTNQLQGTLIVDGVVTPEETLDATTYQFAVKHQKDFNFSEEDLQDIKNEAAPCNLTDYVERNLHYPAKPPLPDFDDSCSPYGMMLTRALDINENFNVYNVKKPHPTDNYDNIDYTDKFFDNPALQSYIHAPHKDWQLCSYVFLHGDNDHSPDRYPDQKHSVLAQAIEKSKKFVMVNGNVSIQTFP